MSKRQRLLDRARRMIPVVILAGAGILCAASGCQQAASTIRGDGFHDEFANWGEKKRTPESEGDLSGVSTKAQQIERNLGVR